LLGLSRIEAEFSALLGGRRADLRTKEDLSRYFREEVERTAEVVYGVRRHHPLPEEIPLLANISHAG
jgi:uncharacterized protein